MHELLKISENAYNTCPVNLETRDNLVNNQNNDQQLGQQSSLAVNHYSLDDLVTLSSVCQILGKDLYSIAKRECQEHQLLRNKINLLNCNKC